MAFLASCAFEVLPRSHGFDSNFATVRGQMTTETITTTVMNAPGALSCEGCPLFWASKGMCRATMTVVYAPPEGGAQKCEHHQKTFEAA